MKAGVLIAGSLAWDDLELRVDWRAKRLDMSAAQRVTAPIMYGRPSNKREKTYTMVFSNDCVEQDVGTGVGLAVPFKAAIESPYELLEEAWTLWRAEAEALVTRRGAVSAGWGSVGLLVRPDRQMDQSFLKAWRTTIRRSPKYGCLENPAGTEPVLDRETGLGAIPWPECYESSGPADFDALFFTPTDPRLIDGDHVTAEVVAEAWISKPHRAEYFWRNRDVGIETQVDAQIEAQLEAAGLTSGSG